MTIGESWRITNRETWTEQAECRNHDPEIFFPPSKSRGLEAKAICAGCPVKVECGAYALREDIRAGVYGGLSEGDRRRLTRTPAVVRPDCGSERGAMRHYKRRERLCPECLVALRDRSRRQRAVPTAATAPKVAERGVQPQQWGPQGGRGTADAS